MKHERIGALADGIFAIAMTLLILDIHVPVGDSLTWQSLLPLLPRLLTLIMSFVLLAIYWSGHHLLFGRLEHASYSFVWRNLWFLLLITLVPFGTALLGEYPYNQVAQFVYGGLLIAGGLQLYRLIYYAHSVGKLLKEVPSLEFKRNVTGKILIPPFMYVVALIVSFWNPRVSLALLILGPAVYFIPIDSKVWAVLTKPFANYFV